MGCKKTAVKVVKAIGDAIQPATTNFIGRLVVQVEAMALEDPLFWTDSVKREMVVAGGRAAARMWEDEASESVIRAVTEYAVYALKKAGAKVEELGDPADYGEDVTV